MPDSPSSDRGSDQPQIWSRVPQRNENFTGREEILEALRVSLTSDASASAPHRGSGEAVGVVLTALQGMGGVGKTQLAVEYAWRFAGEYDLIGWIAADQPILVRSSLAALAPLLHLPSAKAAGVEDAAEAVLEALERGQPYERWLLIFDNADQPEDINNLLRGGPGHVLITSRNHRWQGAYETIAVDVFSRDESIAFLRKRVPRAIASADADRLAQELGDLPLALEQAAALQASTGQSIDEYLQKLAEQTTQLLAEGKPSEYPVSMTAAWSLSVAALRDKLPQAVELLRSCAFFAPEPIPRDVFVPLRAAPPHDDPSLELTIDSELASLLDDPILLSTAIRQLVRYALIRLDSRSRTIQVHRLVQALLRDGLSAADQARIRHAVHVLLANATPGNPDAGANWPRYDDLMAHISPSGVIECSNPAVRSFCLDVVRYMYSSGDLPEARNLIERIIAAWSDPTSVRPSRWVLEAQRHMGIVLRELGDYRAAFKLNDVTLKSMREIPGFDHNQILLLTNSHGADLRAMGDFREALEHDQGSVLQHEAAFGKTDRRTLRAANNLALDYGLVSDYRGALAQHRETFQLQRSLGAAISAQNTLSSWNGLARVLRLGGSYEDAIYVGEEARQFGVQQLGVEHPWTLRTAKDLSIARRMSGDTTTGLMLAEETYGRTLRTLGTDNPDTLAAAMNFANALRMTGNLRRAYSLARDAMTRYPSVYGADHPYSYGCAVNLAILMRTRGEASEARELDERSLAGLDGRVGRDHHFSLTCVLDLASDLAVLGDAQGARRLGEDSLPRLGAVLGEDHPLTMACAANLVHDRRAAGASGMADQLSDELLARYDRTLGMEHPDVKAFRDGRRLDIDFDPPPI